LRIWIDSFIQVPRYVPRFQELNKDFVLVHPFQESHRSLLNPTRTPPAVFLTLRHRNSRHTWTTTYDRRRRQTNLLVHELQPLSQASNSEEPLPALGTADRRVSWHSECLPLPEASNSGEPLPALFPNSGEPLQSPQSEETVAIQKHSQATDSDNSNIHGQENIFREHNDEQVSSDGTVAWERNIRHLHHIAALLTTCPAGLRVKPNQVLPAAQKCKPYSPRYTGVRFSPSPPSTFATHNLHPVSWSAAAKNDDSVASRAHTCAPTSSSIDSRFTQHMCVPLCWKRHALILNHARAAPT